MIGECASVSLPNWVNRVNEPLTEKELDAVPRSIKRGSPFGNQTWVESIARRFGLESTLRPRGCLQVRNLPIPDFVCYGHIVVELKAVKDIAPEHKAQVNNYLKATGMKLGVLVNFGAYPKATITRLAL